MRSLTRHLASPSDRSPWIPGSRATRLLGTRGGLIVGAWQDRRGRLHRLADTRDRHVLAFARSGSGKTSCLVIPTLFEWPAAWAEGRAARPRYLSPTARSSATRNPQ